MQVDRTLTLEWVLQHLVKDGLVSADLAKPLQQAVQARKNASHPLVVIAEQKWPDPQKRNKPLTLERLTEWLAQTYQGVLGWSLRHKPKV